MAPAILLAVVGVAMLCRGLIRWRTDGKRLALVGAAMTLAAAFVYFTGQGNTALAYACGALLAACVLAALVTGRRSWKKPEVILGLAAAATLMTSSQVSDVSTQWYLALTAGVLGFAAIGLTLGALVADTLAGQRE